MMSALNTPGFEQRVRDRAYALWESDGRPAGRHAEHWHLSEAATRAEMVEPVASKPPKKKAKSRKPH